jgi:hypothetical protein
MELNLITNSEKYKEILDGNQNEFYVDVTPYWNKRILTKPNEDGKCHFRLYDGVTIHRGYTQDKVTYQLVSISWNFGNTKNGAPADKKVYIIKLGDIIDASHNTIESPRTHQLTIAEILADDTYAQVLAKYSKEHQEYMKNELKPKVLKTLLDVTILGEKLKYDMNHKRMSRKEYNQRVMQIDGLQLSAAMLQHQELINDYTYDVIFANELALHQLESMPLILDNMNFFDKYYNRDVKMAWNQLYDSKYDKEDQWKITLPESMKKVQDYTPRLHQEMSGYISNFYGWLMGFLKDKGLTKMEGNIDLMQEQREIIARIETATLICMWADSVYLMREESLNRTSMMFKGLIKDFRLGNIVNKISALCKAVCNRIGQGLGYINLEERPEFGKLVKDLNDKFNDPETRTRILTRKAV